MKKSSQMEGLKEGSALITRAVEFEQQHKYAEALDCYQQGLQICMEYMKVAQESEKIPLVEKISQYMTRAEKIKILVEKRLKYHKEIVINDNEIGFGYETVFSHYLNDDVETVQIEDGYVQKQHQMINFVRFCELIVKKSRILRKIILVTKSYNDSKQREFFESFSENLKQRNIDLEIQYSNTLHDRKISFSNGWVFLPGRGLDYFKAHQKNTLGSFDLDLRPCHETKINIHFRPDLTL